MQAQDIFVHGPGFPGSLAKRSRELVAFWIFLRRSSLTWWMRTWRARVYRTEFECKAWRPNRWKRLRLRCQLMFNQISMLYQVGMTCYTAANPNVPPRLKPLCTRPDQRLQASVDVGKIVVISCIYWN